MRSVVVPAFAALVLTGSSTLLAGCSAFSEDGPAADGDGVRVATGFYPLQYVVERVGGDHVTVDNLTMPGKEPHDLELTVQETAAVAQSDLVVFEHGFQPAVDDAVETSAEGAVLDAAETVALRPAGGEADHEGEDEEDQGDLDPHFWQDPVLVADLGDAVADQLGELDPDHADDFATAAADLRADLERLDGDYTAGLEGCERSTVVVSHDAFGYLEKYGLHFEAIAGLSPDAEPTPADLARLQQLIDDEGITTVFGERLAPPALVDTLAGDTGVTTAVLDPVEGLTPETDDEDYLTLMAENLDALRTANGCP